MQNKEILRLAYILAQNYDNVPSDEFTVYDYLTEVMEEDIHLYDVREILGEYQGWSARDITEKIVEEFFNTNTSS